MDLSIGLWSTNLQVIPSHGWDGDLVAHGVQLLDVVVVVVVVLDEEGSSKRTNRWRRVHDRSPEQLLVQLVVVRVHGPVEHHRDDLEKDFLLDQMVFKKLEHVGFLIQVLFSKFSFFLHWIQASNPRFIEPFEVITRSVEYVYELYQPY